MSAGVPMLGAWVELDLDGKPWRSSVKVTGGLLSWLADKGQRASWRYKAAARDAAARDALGKRIIYALQSGQRLVYLTEGEACEFSGERRVEWVDHRTMPKPNSDRPSPRDEMARTHSANIIRTAAGLAVDLGPLLGESVEA